ncbi:hypothetical protein [Anabaena sp. UHCC 0451]|uniref:hypothetical protein n=1 Tax=Anabaena sp. UHCC 0451 TaxID=2055235 RepID=UPI002B217D0B|nr:hypothetical protein [Anabaena sp. UHCC 0451]MEA5578793.1 hypothetical protein [Anabaena sp. UHCC 0451]
MIINQNSLDDSKNSCISQQGLYNIATDIVDAINFLDNSKHLFDMAREQSLTSSDDSIRCELLLEAYELKHTQYMNDLRQLANDLRGRLNNQQRPTLTLVG